MYTKQENLYQDSWHDEKIMLLVSPSTPFAVSDFQVVVINQLSVLFSLFIKTGLI